MGTRIFVKPPKGETYEAEPSTLAELLASDAFVWVSLDQKGTEHFEILTETMALHPLLVEDALNVAPTPKTETHADYSYLVIHGLLDHSSQTGKGDKALRSNRLETVDVDFFLGDRLLVTHHRMMMPSLSSVRELVLTENSPLKHGPARVAHALIDRMIDAFFPALASLEEEVVDAERAALEEADPALLQHIFKLKHALQDLRRVGVHQQDVLKGLTTGRVMRVDPIDRPFFRDVEDHFVRVMDIVQMHREIVDSSLDAYLSMQNHRLNEVMKVLTVISTIMLPLTFITGLYGMNFDEMPLIHWRFGWEAAWALMLSTAGVFWLFGKKRGWV